MKKAAKEEEEKKVEQPASQKFVTKGESKIDTIPVEKSVDHSHTAVTKKEEFAEKVVEEVVHH